MAVLKSPRNNKNKIKWALRYNIQLASPSAYATEKLRPRSVHKAQITLKRALSTTDTPLYNSATLGSMSPSPLVFCKHLTQPSHRERFFFLLSLNKIT